MYVNVGIDIGSTTVKIVVVRDGEIIHKHYERHFSKVREKAVELVRAARGLIGEDTPIHCSITGSAGLGVAKAADIDFVQEVFATRKAVGVHVPAADVVIELGGEDAKIVFLTGQLEERMNGSCAGGTGAFIDQMAVLLDVTPSELDHLAQGAERIYTIASRCGVFAKSDIQPLLNEGARKEDVAASIFQAVVNQTIAGLAQGREVKGDVLFLGGPLFFFKGLQKRFQETLGLDDEHAHFPALAPYAIAAGAAEYAGTTSKTYTVSSLLDALEKAAGAPVVANYLPPLFESEQQYEEFKSRHSSHDVMTQNVTVYEGDAYLGIDCGSTTTKLVLIGEDDQILFHHYQSNKGNPADVIREQLTKLYELCGDRVHIVSSAVTGYGEALIQNAFGVDFGLVETVAHFRAARHFCQDVDFIIDIGGQDIKCFKIRNKCIDNISLNEACSSGCGSFIETFARSMGYSIEEFCKLGLFAKHPIDLGSRCTVFMNSSVKQAQKDGAPVEAISAGLSISVAKNAIYKVIRAASAADLGERIVVQGGTFLNDAVLRAFEQELNTEVTRPGIAGLMGAYGAALYALAHRPAESMAPTAETLERFTYTSAPVVCKGCTNACRLSVSTFAGNRRYISGNKCDKPLRKSEEPQAAPLPNLIVDKSQLLQSYRPVKGTRGTVGIPMGLNFYENLPFWHAFFTALGYEVIVSPPSTRSLYLRGQATIPSDTVCYPAKLMHGHIDALLRMGADTIFYPCMSYNFDEQLGDNHFNCPVVAYYPEVAAANIRPLRDVRFIYDYLDLSDPKRFAKKAVSVFRRSFDGLTAREIRSAADAAYAEYAAYTAQVRRKGEEALEEARRRGLPVIVLCGRPYHLDAEINHGIDELIRSMGAVVISEDALGGLLHRAETGVLNQWTYHARLYAAAEFVCARSAEQPIDLVQLVSFGCGIDAITTDEMRRILESHGKIYTQIKIDEITNLGAVRIRLRSLFSALDDTRKGGGQKQP